MGLRPLDQWNLLANLNMSYTHFWLGSYSYALLNRVLFFLIVILVFVNHNTPCFYPLFKSYKDYFKVYFKYNLPRSPINVYKKKYKGWNDFVGAESFYNYDQAKKILSKFKLRNMWEYQKLLSQNNNLKDRLPKTPSGVYFKTGEWKG